MKTIINNKKASTAGLVIILMSILGTAFFYSANNSLTKNLNEEKLKTEMILSEKLKLQKEIINFRTEIKALEGKNSEIDKILGETSKKLIKKESEVDKMVHENGNLKNLKKQLAELVQMKKVFEGQIVVFNETIQKLNLEKIDKDAIIASLQNENKQLASNLDILSSMTADNYLVETTKRKDKLTIIAKRAKKMSVSFKVPENVVEKISFKVTKPDGTSVEGKDNGVAYRVLNNDDNLLASLSKEEIKVSKKIEMTYEPKEKLKSGIYKIEMYNGEKYIGSCNVKLR